MPVHEAGKDEASGRVDALVGAAVRRIPECGGNGRSQRRDPAVTDEQVAAEHGASGVHADEHARMDERRGQSSLPRVWNETGTLPQPRRVRFCRISVKERLESLTPCDAGSYAPG